jgi:DNA-binding response OmpR family regulator
MGRPAGLALVVDDEPAIRELCRVTLELEGFEVVEAGDGEAALEQVKAHVPHIVFLDLMMPRMDGWQAFEALRSEPATAGIPVVVMSARSGEDDQQRAWESGVFDYVQKPFHPQVLVDLARTALQPRDAAAEAERRRQVLEQLAAARLLRSRNPIVRPR